MTVINQTWLNDNAIAARPFGDRLVGYLATPVGLFRQAQLIRGVSKILSEIPSPIADNAKEMLGFANGCLSILSLLGLQMTARDMVDGTTQLRDFQIALIRKVGILFKDVVGNVTPWLSAGMALSGSLAFKNVVVIADMASDAADLGMAISDCRKAARLETQATGEAQRALNHSKNYYLLKTAKLVASFAGKAVSIAFVYAQITLVSIVALTAFSLFTLSLAASSEIYKEAGPYKVIKFDREVTLGVEPEVVIQDLFVHAF